MNVLKLLGANPVSAGALTIAFRSSATSEDASVTAPSDIVSGDLLVLYDRAVNVSGNPTAVTPSGFTTVFNATDSTTRRTICSFKIANGTEAGASITGMDGNSADFKILLVFSTNGATTALSFAPKFESTDGDPVAQVVPASQNSNPLVVLSFMRQVTATGQSFSPTQDGTVTNGTANTAYYKIYNSGASDVTVDCGDGGNANALMSFYIAVYSATPTSGSLYSIISGLSLTTNLELCLDAGDSASYDPAVQTVRWLDVSGNGFDFFRGATSSSEASDPTFNGSAGGLSVNEYWSFDGGDYFTYDTTNETWMNNLHKDGATYTIFFAFNYVLGTQQALFSTRGTNQGLNFNMSGINNGIQVQIFNDASAVNLGVTSTLTATFGWNIGAVSVNETAGTGVFMLNGSTETFTSTYTGTVSTSNVTSTTKIATRATAAALTALNGARIACSAIWEGTALTATNLTDIYNQIKGRFGL